MLHATGRQTNTPDKIHKCNNPKQSQAYIKRIIGYEIIK